jgi:hypothetical protein
MRVVLAWGELHLDITVQAIIVMMITYRLLGRR